MYPEQSMKPPAIFEEAFKADGLSAVAVLVMSLAGCLALISAEWAIAALFLSGSAVLGVGLREKLGPKTERSKRWTTGLLLAAGVAFLGVSCASVVGGDIVFAVLSGLAAVTTLAATHIGWRRSSNAGRPKISV
jgi:hypothetical protein